MTLHATIELPEGSCYTTHCPDLQSLTKRLSSSLLHAVVTSTHAPELPRVTVTHFDTSPICGHCAAPLKPSGACSNPACGLGRLRQRKPTAKELARKTGTRLASTLKRIH